MSVVLEDFIIRCINFLTCGESHLEHPMIDSGPYLCDNCQDMQDDESEEVSDE